jgi:hypothetical protein
MVKFGRSAATVLAVLLLSGASIGAPAVSAHLDLHMVMYMAGIKAGKVRLSVDLDDADAVSRLDLESGGILALLTGYEGQSAARTSLEPGEAPQPLTFDSSYETNRYDRKVEIRYDPEGGDITELRTWKRGKPQRSDVPEALRQDTIDPLTAVLRLRQWVLALRAGDAAEASETYEVFDGRRRYDLTASLLERGRIEADGETLPVFRLKAKLVPKAGFSSKDMLANWAAEGEDRWIELVLTDDPEPAPVLIRTHGGSLETVIELKKMCRGEDDCRKF